MSAYVSLRQPTSAYVSIRQHADLCWLQVYQAWCPTNWLMWHCWRPWTDLRNLFTITSRIRQHTSAYVSIRQHTSAYVSIRHCWRPWTDLRNLFTITSRIRQAYVSIRQHTSQHTSAYVIVGVREQTSETCLQLKVTYVYEIHEILDGKINYFNSDWTSADSYADVCWRMLTYAWRMRDVIVNRFLRSQIEFRRIRSQTLVCAIQVWFFFFQAWQAFWLRLKPKGLQFFFSNLVCVSIRQQCSRMLTYARICVRTWRGFIYFVLCVLCFHTWRAWLGLKLLVYAGFSYY
jgi:hypothetical protein